MYCVYLFSFFVAALSAIPEPGKGYTARGTGQAIYTPRHDILTTGWHRKCVYDNFEIGRELIERHQMTDRNKKGTSK